MKRLLIVDDNADHRLILRTVFEAKGYGCAEAQEGTAALSTLVDQKADLVLTDLVMPGMNGVELIERMRELDFLQHIPVIILTSRSRDDLPPKCYPNNVRAVMTKPYDFYHLFDEVGRAMLQSELAEVSKIA